jgi:Domain of unknown function (DUF6471)
MARRIIVNGKSNVYSDIRISHAGETMKTEDDWAEDAKRLLRAEMTRRGVTYDELTARLADIGVSDTAVNIRNKVARGKFAASFLLQCLSAIGAKNLRLTEDHED